jgi:hypothetical protein
LDLPEVVFRTSATRIDRTVEVTAKTIAPIIAGAAPSTLNPGTIRAVKYKIAALIINVKRPKVKKLIGAVIKISKGLRNVLIIPIAKADNTATKKPSILNPSTTLEVIIKARAFNIRAITNFIGSNLIVD